MLLTQLGRAPKVAVFVALALTFLIVVHLSSFPSLPKWRLPTSSNHPEAEAGQDASQKASDEPSQFDSSKEASANPAHGQQEPERVTNGTNEPSIPCQALAGGEDVLVVMRTGATEIKDKLPAHLNTTFECYPNLLIFSDFEEDFRGHKVHDVLRDIPEDIKSTNDDFQHYLHVQEAGRKNLNDDELSGKLSLESGPVGKNDNAGWRLDKWKFLPMVNRTLELHPEKKWFVFVEPDTYLVWSNLLQWIPKLDPEKALYYGSEVMIGDDMFAHGGSAFLMSKPAMEKGAEIYNTKAQEWHDWTAGHWAGDCVLGKALREAGVELTWSWPQFQGGNPSFSLNWEDTKGDKALWCTPAISYHHFSPFEIRNFWQFEQSWIRSILEKQVQQHPERGFRLPFWGDDMTSVLHHRDTFKSYVLPNMTAERAQWNNTPDYAIPDTANMTLDGCRERCVLNSTCLQYALGPEGCKVGEEPRMGQRNDDASSGWITERIEDWMKKLDHCWGKDGWAVT